VGQFTSQPEWGLTNREDGLLHKLAGSLLPSLRPAHLNSAAARDAVLLEERLWAAAVATVCTAPTERRGGRRGCTTTGVMAAMLAWSSMRRRKQRSEQHRGSASGLRCGGGRSHGNAKEEVHWPLSPPRTNDPTATKWSHGLTADWADRLNHLRAARKAELTKLLGRDETWGLRATGK
jgi:hypothetical protein